MKKMMFNDKYGLTQAVLDGRKTMTRREIKNEDALILAIGGDIEGALTYARYQVGEVVAIAQSYRDILPQTISDKDTRAMNMIKSKGFGNKMFVKSYLMPHHIRITNIRVERLHDISDEDCLREGVIKRGEFFGVQNVGGGYNTARGMFEWLIDKVSKKGTWDINPYVFVYEFELVD